jgi:hypothetical protein
VRVREAGRERQRLRYGEVKREWEERVTLFCLSFSGIA